MTNSAGQAVVYTTVTELDIEFWVGLETGSKRIWVSRPPPQHCRTLV